MTTPRQRAVEEFCRKHNFPNIDRNTLAIFKRPDGSKYTRDSVDDSFWWPDSVEQFRGILDAKVFHPFEYVEDELDVADEAMSTKCRDNPTSQSWRKAVISRIKSLEARLDKVENSTSAHATNFMNSQIA